MCLGTGLFFAFRAATPDARATAAVPAVTVSGTFNAAVPDTVLTTCNIEDIQAGDLVLARDEHGQEIGLKPVKEVDKRTSFHLRHLTFESTDGDQQALSTTDEHPFWSVTADEFVEAGSLPVGHKVTDPHGKTQTLVSSTREEFPNGIPVFNFQVEDFHTYYVAANAGDDVLLVHNADYDDAEYLKYWQGDMPAQVTPGISLNVRQQLASNGKYSYDAVGHYDEFGRLVGRTDFSTHPSTGLLHPNPHYHLRNEFFGDKTAENFRGSQMPEWLKGHLPGVLGGE